MADSVAAVLRSIDLADVAVAARVVEIQQAAYRVEADMIGFDRIPPLLETIDDGAASHCPVSARSRNTFWLASSDRRSPTVSATSIASRCTQHSHDAFTATDSSATSSKTTRLPSQRAPTTFPHDTSTRASATSARVNT